MRAALRGRRFERHPGSASGKDEGRNNSSPIYRKAHRQRKKFKGTAYKRGRESKSFGRVRVVSIPFIYGNFLLGLDLYGGARASEKGPHRLLILPFEKGQKTAGYGAQADKRRRLDRHRSLFREGACSTRIVINFRSAVENLVLG